MCFYIVQPKLVQVIDGGAQANGVRNIGGAGFELVRQPVVNGFVEGNGRDHVTAALIWWHGFQQGGFAIKNTNPRGPIHLMA